MLSASVNLSIKDQLEDKCIVFNKLNPALATVKSAYYKRKRPLFYHETAKLYTYLYFCSLMITFANRLLITPVLCALLCLYLGWTYDSAAYAIWMAPFLVLSAVIYVLSPQINWWYYSRNPPEMAPPLRMLLEQRFVFYRKLAEAERKKFRARVELFRMGTDWTAIDFPEDALPPDIQVALAAQAVMLSFHKPEFLFKKFEKVVVYPYPFPSPAYDFPHTSELHEADGCLLFSAQQFMPVFLDPGYMYNIGLHEYARAFVLSYPEYAYPVFSDESHAWAMLERSSGMSREHIESLIGIPGQSPLPVAIHHYFTFPESLLRQMPEVFTQLNIIFSQP